MTSDRHDSAHRTLSHHLGAVGEAPPESIRARLSADLRGAARYAPFEQEVCEHFELPREALREALAAVAHDADWHAGPWPKSQVLNTAALAQYGTVLARLAPGTAIAAHGHTQRELTYVLSGELTESRGRVLRAGEVLDVDAADVHALQVTGADACLVVFGLRPDD